MTVPPTPDPDIPGGDPDVPTPHVPDPDVPGRDAPDEPADVADFVPDNDLAAQAENAWPEADEDEVVPDPDRVVIDDED
jgi:hypothetical protein